jgi:hypothetical protein
MLNEHGRSSNILFARTSISIPLSTSQITTSPIGVRLHVVHYSNSTATTIRSPRVTLLPLRDRHLAMSVILNKSQRIYVTYPFVCVVYIRRTCLFLAWSVEGSRRLGNQRNLGCVLLRDDVLELGSGESDVGSVVLLASSVRKAEEFGCVG